METVNGQTVETKFISLKHRPLSLSLSSSREWMSTKMDLVASNFLRKSWIRESRVLFSPGEICVSHYCRGNTVSRVKRNFPPLSPGWCLALHSFLNSEPISCSRRTSDMSAILYKNIRTRTALALSPLNFIEFSNSRARVSPSIWNVVRERQLI